MKILNKLKSNGVRYGLCLAVSLFWSRAARAEVTLVESDGWTFSFDGRVNAFLSGGKGDDFPTPTPSADGAMHIVMGGNSPRPGVGIADVGWPSSYQQDAQNKYLAIRVRSGTIPNVLGFGLKRNISDTTTVKAYVSIWSTVETLGRDKWAPVNAEAREGYFTATGPWGSATAGRMLGWVGRSSYDIDMAYGHGYGLGLPCTDGLGPACGHIGTGVLFPGYSAGFSYSTPDVGGLQVHLGVYDPIVFSPNTAADWSHATFVRPEGAVTFYREIGMARLKLGVEGLYQPLSRVNTVATDPANPLRTNVTTSVWGVSGGARVEVGPVRVGVSGFRGRGLGLGYALQRSSATADDDPSAAAPGGNTYQLRTFTGYHGQLAFIRGRLHLTAGYGVGIVDQLPVDKLNGGLSVIHTQAGVSAAVYYHLSDSVVVGLDYFRFMASWYGAPVLDANMLPTGGKLVGEKQTLDFLNLGVTYHW